MTKLLLLAVVGVVGAFAQSPGDRILGLWKTPTGDSTIEVSKCGELFCGAIQSMPKPMNDVHNADASLRGRPLLGLQILKGFRYDGADTWSGGTLYGPERGKEVSPKLVLADAGSLEIRVSLGIARKTIVWTRAK